MIKKNNQPIEKIYKGTTEIAKIYKGSALVYQNIKDMIARGINFVLIHKAKANSLNYLKRFGKCEQNGTPTPDSPVDIMCNNGAIKVGRETYTTPLGRTVYGGTLNVTTGVLTVDMAIVDMGTLNWMYYSAQKRIVAQINGAKPAGSNIGFDGACSVYKVVNTAYRLAPDKSIIIGNNFISNSYAAMVVHDEDYTDAETFKTAVSGHTLVYPIKTPVTYQLSPQEVEMIAEWSTFQSNASGNIDITYYANGILKTVSGNPVVITDADGQNAEDVTVHIEPIQSGSGTPSPTNIRPISGMTDINITRLGGVVADGTPEVLTVQGKNMFGLKQWLDSLNITYTQQGEKFTITSNGSLYTNPWVFSDTDVKVKFSCKSFTNETTTKARITFLDTDDNVVSSRYADDVFTSNVTASKCRFDWSRGGTFSIEEAQIELGSTATAYEPYSAQTASVENLLAVGNYKDEQDIISGTVTRKCGIKVLNGSENWTYDSRYSRFYTTISDMQVSTQVRTTTVNVTHYICIDDGRQIQDVPNNSIYVVGNDRGIYIKTNEYTTVTSYKQFLADQYNAGTPVIVLYPLATEATETATAQPVNIQKGVNTIQVTQASINDLELEIKYKGK